MHLLNHHGLPEQSAGASRGAARFVTSARFLRLAPALLVWALLGAFGPLDSAKAQAPNPRAVILTPISDRNSESDSLGTRPGPLPSFQVSLRDADVAGTNVVIPTQDVFITLAVQNLNAGADSNPEALIATVAQPVFRQQQVLLFTPANYAQPQIVTVQGVDGPTADGDQTFRVVILSITSGDAGYNNLASAVNQQVQGVNTDNDAPANGVDGIDLRTVDNQVLTPLETNENGARAQFSVVLRSQPSADVTINLQTSDPTEGKILDLGSLVDATSITFSPDPTAANAWNVPQLVTVQGVDDVLADGNIPYRIITTTSTTDAIYAAINAQDVLLTNNDNETPGLTLSPSFVVVYEGQTATVSAVLNRVPTSQVRFVVSVNDATEARLNRSELVFDASNYNVPQDIVVTGVQDNIIDGDRPFIITVGNGISTDPNYNGNFGNTLNGVTIDTDKAIVNIQPPGGLETTEAGATATFLLSLASMPQAGTTVTINLSSNDTTEGTVAPAVVVFTQANWNVPRTVTITGVDDLLIDGDQNYRIDLAIAGGAGSDPNYQLVQLQPVTVINRDDGETAGVKVTPTTGLTTGEDGTSATFAVSLTSQPTANVTLQLSSSDITEGVVTPSRLTFTTANFATPQAVTVTGVDDAIDDGNVVYQIILAQLVSTDPNYRFDPADLSVTNFDDDTRGISIAPTTGLITTEAGGRDTFHAALDTQPVANVTLNMSTTANGEITFSPAQIVFTADDPPAGSASNFVRWDRGLDVTVTGVDDTVIDGDKPWSIDTAPLVSADPIYNGLNPANVTGVNQDNDSAGITVRPSFVLVSEGGVTSFTVVLNAKPSTSVVLPLSINRPLEAILDQTQLVFTTTNYNVPQRVRVTGIDDGLVDGNQLIVVTVGAAVSGDPLYNGLFRTPINGIVLDSAVKPGVTIVGPAPNITGEDGTAVTFSVVLDTQPAANVTLNLHSDNTNEGVVTPARLIFTSANWNVPQAVTVTGRDDQIDDGAVDYNVITDPLISGDPRYNNLDPRDVPLVNVDDDTRGILITPTTGLNTSEDGTSDTFHVALSSQPTANVVMQLVSAAPGEVSVSPSTVTLTPGTPAAGSPAGTARWDVGVDVKVTGVDDLLLDGNKAWRVTTQPLQSADPLYNGLNPPDVTGINQDNDSAGITVRPQFVIVSEGASTNITVVLNVKPTSSVFVPLAVSNNEVLINKTELTFTTTNFNVPQTVRVTGINDGLRDGNQPFQIIVGAPLSSDPNYLALGPLNVDGICRDFGVLPGITLSPLDTTQTSEAGDAATFTAVLNTQPAANVTLDVRSTNTAEGIVTPARLTFTSLNWNTPQVVTITGRDDKIDDGNVSYNVVTDPSVSADPNYNGVNPRDFTLLNLDDDTSGIAIDPTSGLVTTEAGGTATFNARLNSQPSANVTLTMSTRATGEINFTPRQIVFTAGDPPAGAAANFVRWDRGLNVTVTGVDDAINDGDKPWSIDTAALFSPDPLYNGINPPNVTGINQDDETPGLILTPRILVTTEGQSTLFSARLTVQPTSNVRFAVTVSDASEVSLSQNFLLFTPADYNQPHKITLSGVRDFLRDGDVNYTLDVANAVSSDPAYSGKFAASVPGTNVDVDIPGVTVSTTRRLETSEQGGTDQFTVVLNSRPQPGNVVVIRAASTDATEGTVAPAALTFDGTNWNVPQTVTVTGVDDLLLDGDQNYQVVLNVDIAVPNRDMDFDFVAIPSLSAVNHDNEKPGITVSALDSTQTNEAGDLTATFTVVLNTQPSANVTIDSRSTDTTEGVVTPTRLVFTPVNWNTPQAVTITGRDDKIDDGNVPYSVITSPAVSADPNYNGINPRDFLLLNLDDDTRGVTITPTGGLVTTEAGGTATFNVRLDTQPTASVTLDLSTRATGEITFSPTRIIFIPGDPPAGSAANLVRWDRGLDVTVTGVDDAVVDPDRPWSIDTAPLTSPDPVYDGFNPLNVTGINQDNETAGLILSPRILVTTEGQSSELTARLTVQPTANVRFALSVDKPAEVSLGQNFLLFTPADYNQPHKVNLSGVRDFLRDGDQPFTLNVANAVSSDPAYSGKFADSLPGTNVDVDIPGVTVSPRTRRLQTTEQGGTDQFTVVLNSRPQPGNVVSIKVVTSDATEGRITPLASGTLTFDETNWNVSQTVTVRGINDSLQDGDQPYQIILNVDNSVPNAEPDYQFVSIPSLNAINLDDEKPGVTVTPSTGLTTTENGPGLATFNVVLNGPPTAPVFLTLHSTNIKEGRLIDPATSRVDTDNSVVLTFTATNFNIPQTITVQGVDDMIADGDVDYRVDFKISSGDAGFAKLIVAPALLTNLDDDVAGVAVTPTSGLRVSESGTTDTFTVSLTSQPTADEVLTLMTGDATEATINVVKITFSPDTPTQSDTAATRFARWDQPVLVTVRGVRDNQRDGDQAFSIVTNQLTGADATYSRINPPDVRGVTQDIDIPDVLVLVPTAGILTSESGGLSRFNVKLATKPTQNVTIPLSVSDTTEARLDVTQLVFTPLNWNTVQTVTVTGVNDLIEDGSIVYRVVIGKVISSDANYRGIDPTDLQGINADDDDRTRPTVSITSPRADAFVKQLSTISGLADDPASPTTGITTGIKKVEVRLFRFDNPALPNDKAGYYNGTTGGFDPVFDPSVNLLLATYDKVTKIWTLTIPKLTGTPPTLPSGHYFARATATDNADKTVGNSSNVLDSDRIEFTVDTVAPLEADVKITTPINRGVYTTLSEARGTAKDEIGGTGISRVRVIVYRYANAATGVTAGYMESGGTFSDAFSSARNLLDTAGQDDNGTFSFTFLFTPPLAAGKYFIQAVAEDKAGNEGRSVRVVFTMRNTSGGGDDFIAGQTYLISMPYEDSNVRNSTTTPDQAFNVTMFDPITGEQRYILSRFDATTQSYVFINPADLLKRGEGYFLKPITTNMRILRPGDDPTRIALAASITDFLVTLRRNPSANPSDQSNGFNLIGDPFSPEVYIGADWVNATVDDHGTIYPNVAAAAAAGVVDSRLFTFNAATGGYDPVTTNMEPFKGYYVKTFVDGVKVTLKAVSATP